MASRGESATKTRAAPVPGGIAPAAAALLAVFASCDGKRTAGRDGGPGFDFKDPERIVLEIESGKVGTPFELASDAECSGGRCAVLEEGEEHAEKHPRFRTGSGTLVPKYGLDKNPAGEKLLPNGTVEIKFTVKKAATYDLWVRSWFCCGCGNSFDLSVDSPPPVDTDGDGKWDENVPHTFSHSTYRRWQWVDRRDARFRLDEGEHVVRIFNREDGIKLDQVFMQELGGGAVEPYTPTGIEKQTP